MSLRNTINEIQRVFSQADELTKQVQLNSGVSCLPGCGRCCNNPKIEAYPLEFLPFAVSLEEQGIAESFLEELELSESDLCPIYKPSLNGSCSNYTHRGLICRLFGYGAMRNKSGKKKLVTCKEIKAAQPENVLKAESFFMENAVPLTSRFYDELKDILPSLATDLFPVKKAVIKALEYVLVRSYYEKLDSDFVINPPDDDNGPLPIPA